MDGVVPPLQPVIEMREHREVAAERFERLQERRRFVIRPGLLRPEAPGYMPNSLPTQTIRQGGVLASAAARGAATIPSPATQCRRPPP